MPKSVPRTYARYTQIALRVLGNMIHVARKERRVTAAELAERAGISRGLLRRVEAGDPKCEIGVVFEVARIVGIPLFDRDEDHELTELGGRVRERLVLLPRRVRVGASEDVDDDF
ncbi:MAG: helix-turn-helix domain-containing protein [Deltaproteobacteria bacterium]|nr:helix-turn-helix domain-containing protein [Deltaproteobacteria bacterium]